MRICRIDLELECRPCVCKEDLVSGICRRLWLCCLHFWREDIFHPYWFLQDWSNMIQVLLRWLTFLLFPIILILGWFCSVFGSCGWKLHNICSCQSPRTHMFPAQDSMSDAWYLQQMFMSVIRQFWSQRRCSVLKHWLVTVIPAWTWDVTLQFRILHRPSQFHFLDNFITTSLPTPKPNPLCSSFLN